MGDILNISDVDGICRLCLREDGTIIPIFGRETTSRDCIPLSKKIFDCVSVKVAREDGMPNMICVGCVHQVDSWHGFKNSCETSQKKLSSWLEKTNPQAFAKNKAEEHKQLRAEAAARAKESAVIDLSSDEENEIVVATPHPRLMNKSLAIQRRKSTPQRRNINLLSITTNEIEILPVSDATKSRENFDGVEIFPTKSTVDNVASEFTENDIENPVDPTEDHILPDKNMNENSNPAVIERVEQTKDTNKSLPNGDITEDPLSMNIEQVQINETEFNSMPDNESQGNDNESQDYDNIDNEDNDEDMQADEHGSEDNSNELQNDQTQSPTVDTVGETLPEVNKTSQNDEPVLENSDSPKNEAASENKASEENDNSEHLSGKTQEKSTAENSDDSSLIIGQVTSLTSQNNDADLIQNNEDSRKTNEEVQEEATRTDEESNNRDVDMNEEITIIDDNWNADSMDGSQSSYQPDIVMCDGSSMIANIKEEPVSAEDEEIEEDDPLNFHSVTIKREPTEWALTENEVEDVKPNVLQLNETIQNQDYTPKQLKNGKILCEPCRSSFLGFTNYERHTNSLRHRFNLKLFRLGKAPTRYKGKALLRMARGKMGLYRSCDEPGTYYCTECPSVFKYRRNLQTHKKKHLMEIRPITPELDLNEVQEELPERSQSRAASVSSHESSRSNKPQRLSAQLAKFKDLDDLECEICQKHFVSLSGLFSHKRYCGTTMFNKRCKFCHQKFTTHNGFNRHRKACREMFGFRDWRNIPRKVPPLQPISMPSPTTSQPVASVPLDGTVLACTLCSLTFESPTELITHMQENHMDFGKPEQPLPNFAKPKSISRYNDSRMHYCKYCLKSFPSLGALTSHAGYHVRQSQFWCKFCKTPPFTSKLTFRQHMKVHISNPALNNNVCWMCYTKFDSPQTLADHKANHLNTNVRVFSCSYCDNSYNTRELLSKHRQSAHFSPTKPSPAVNHQDPDRQNTHDTVFHLMDEDNKLYKCKICKSRFASIANLKRHIQTIHPKGLTPVYRTENSHQGSFKCVACFRTFDTHVGLMKHRHYCIRFKKSASYATGMIKCQDCKKYFASKSTLYKHRLFKRCRPGVEVEVQETTTHLKHQNCPNCDQEFLSEESLYRHKQHCKPSIDKLTCDCGEVFTSLEMKSSHAESCSANCTCNVCNLKFNSPDELESHSIICKPNNMTVTPASSPVIQQKLTPLHQESRFPPIDCPKCNKRFIYHKSFLGHQEKCFNNRWPCTGCSEVFPNEGALAKHKTVCTMFSPHRIIRVPSDPSLNEGPTFKCDCCPMLFFTQNELQQHFANCEYKPAQYQDSSYVKPFACDLCGKRFSWKANLQRHYKTAHSGSDSVISISDSESVKKPDTSTTSSSEVTIGFYKCKLCPDIVFHKKQGFLEHRMVHEREAVKRKSAESQNQSGDSPMLTCELCEKKLPEALYHLHMDEHMNDDFEGNQADSTVVESTTQEEKVEKFPCDVCGKVFDTYVSRKSHRASHYRNNDVLSHLKSPSKKKKRLIKAKHVRCNVCHKLLSINSMPKHRMMHRRENAEFFGENESVVKSVPSAPATPTMMVEFPTKEESPVDDSPTVFPCPHCDRIFKLRKSLMDHMKTHSEEGKETDEELKASGYSSAPGNVNEFAYKCVYCDLSWKHKSVYERHLNSKKHSEIQKQLADII